MAGGNGYAGADAGSVAPSPVEISAPMSQGFSFMRQKRAFLPDMQFSFTYTINPDFAKDCFVTQFLPATVSPIVNAHTDTTGACKLLDASRRP